MPPDRWRLAFLPWVVAGASLAITAWAWHHERQNLQRSLKADFDFSVRQTASRIESRMAAYEQMLRGVQGLFHATGTVRREQFEAYVDTLLGGADFAGIQFFAFVPLAVSAAGTQAPLAYLAPASVLNQQLLAADAYANPVWRQAMQRAADSSGLGITQRLGRLFGSEAAESPGFVMVLPLYASGAPGSSVAARRQVHSGWVLAGVRMSDLMSSLYGEGVPGLALRVHDGVNPDPDTLMYASGNGAAAGAMAEVTAPPPARRSALEYIGVAGHTWTLAVSAGPAFESRVGADSARVIAGSGLATSLLLALLTGQLVSGRQRARDAALAMTQEVRASEERYRRIVETADEGIWVTDEQSRTTFVNPKMAQLLGHDSAELIGRTPSEFQAPAPAPASAAHVLAGDAEDNGDRAREIQFRRKNGDVLWASVATSRILDARGQPAGTLSMVTDISTRKEADAARRELEAQLRESQKMEAIGTLAGGIAHDFNNILAAILGNVALAQQRAGADAVLNDGLQQIGQAAVRARSLVQQILAFSRRQPHRLVEQPLQPVVDESLRLLRPLLPAVAALDLQISSTPLVVLADATQLQQVVMNLCTNAWHALGGQPGRITVGLAPVALDADAAARLGLLAGRHARLWVSDTGSGMDEATRQRVFEPFFTTKPLGQGTGLGLSVVHGIVATHGGAITVASRPGEGSRFDVYLPMPEQPARSAPAVAGLPATAHADGRHVMYVDDDPVVLAMVQALLQHQGYRVSCFENPHEAIAALRARPEAFDVAVTDYNMPELSGLDVVRAFRQIRPGLAVIISSGFITEEMNAAASQAGVHSVMQKEYTLERLPGLLQGILEPAPPIAAAK